MQLVNLTEGGERVQMSKRAGRWCRSTTCSTTSAWTPRAGSCSSEAMTPRSTWTSTWREARARTTRLLRAVRARPDRRHPRQGGGGARSTRRSRPISRPAPRSLHPVGARPGEAACWSCPDEAARTPPSGARRTGSRPTPYETAQDFSAFYRDVKVVGAAEEGGDEDCGSRSRWRPSGCWRARLTCSGSRRRWRCSLRRAFVTPALAALLWPLRPAGGRGPLRADEGRARARASALRQGLRAAARAPRTPATCSCSCPAPTAAPAASPRWRATSSGGCRAPRSGSWTGASRPSRTPACSRRRDPQAAQDHYLGFKYRARARRRREATWPSGASRCRSTTSAGWSSVRAPAGRRVMLGGHSAGASTAVAYAAWDFHGRPGYRDLDGLVLIDGGLREASPAPRSPRARRELAEIRTGSVFLDLLGAGHSRDRRDLRPGGCAVGGHESRTSPRCFRTTRRSRPPSSRAFRVTNLAEFGYAFDSDTSPEGLELIRMQRGRARRRRRPARMAGRGAHVAAPLRRARTRRTPRTPPSGTTRAASCSTSTPPAAAPDAPRRGTSACASRTPGRSTTPLYAFGTALTDGAVARGARG